MALFSRELLLVLMLLVFRAKIGQSVRVSIYKETNYKGFVEEVILTKERELDCVDFSDAPASIGSVKSDKCLVIYRKAGCQSQEYVLPIGTTSMGTASFRIEGDTPRIPSSGSGLFPARNIFRSFHVCSQKRGGGPQLDLDVFGGFLRFLPVPPTFVQEHKHTYRGVCDCRNFPSWVPETSSPRIAYINNYGNSVNIYSREDCQGVSKYVAAGQVADAWKLADFSFYVRSFKPAELSHCYRLAARIHKFHFTNGTTSEDDLEIVKVQLAASDDINNNGASEIIKIYRLSSTFSNTVEFSVTKSLSQVHSAGVEVGAEFTVTKGVPLVASAEVKASIKANYQYTRTEGSEERNTTTTKIEKGIEIEQQIKIPACKTCTITTFVKQVKGFVIKYKAYAYVSAPEDSAPMTADVIRKNLPEGLDYVRDVDEHTIEAVTDGSMYADFGIKSVVDDDCVPIPTCEPSHFSMDDHQVYESPLHVLPQNKLGSDYEPSATRSTILPFIRHTLGLLMKHLC